MIGKGTKLSVKIGGGFGIFLVLLLALSIGTYVALQLIGGSAEHAMGHFGDRTFLLAKEIDHLNWMGKVTELFVREDAAGLAVETGDHKCGFGKWLYSDATQAMIKRGGEEVELLTAIPAPRQLLGKMSCLGKGLVGLP